MPEHGVPGLAYADHTVGVPLDHDRPDGPWIEVFAREVRAAGHADRDRPWLLYLEGGPGSPAPRPTARAGWLAEAVERFHVLLMDQRGTGRSTPVTRHTDLRDPAYLTHFRADAVVRDAEVLRREVAGGRPWTTLGQSYGGFCTATYLSLAPAGLERCLVAGGIPPVGAGPDEVYAHTWRRVADRNRTWRSRFPFVTEVLARVRDRVADGVDLPTGERLTLARLRSLGLDLGRTAGPAELAWLLETAFDGTRLSDGFLAEVARRTSLAARPLYALLQEAIYCEGEASRWAASRVRAGMPDLAEDADPLLLTGETVEPSAYDGERLLAPLRPVAEWLHAKDDWPALYDRERLARNEVPVDAVVYAEDMYVDLDLSVRALDGIAGVRTRVAPDLDHDALRVDPGVFTRLLATVSGA